MYVTCSVWASWTDAPNRLGEDIVGHFEQGESGDQSRINDVRRAYGTSKRLKDKDPSSRFGRCIREMISRYPPPSPTRTRSPLSFLRSLERVLSFFRSETYPVPGNREFRAALPLSHRRK